MKKIGEFYMERSEFDKAGEWLGKAVMQVQGTEPHIVKAKIYETLGHYFLKTGQVSMALEAFLQVKATFDKIGYPLG